MPSCHAFGPVPSKPPTPPRTPLQVRHAAALKLVAAGELTPEEALWLVVWPPRGSRLADDHVPGGRQVYPEELKAELRACHAAGEALPALAQSTGIPVGTLKMVCSPSGAKRYPRRKAERALTLS